jgi:hypothetical protein
MHKLVESEIMSERARNFKHLTDEQLKGGDTAMRIELLARKAWDYERHLERTYGEEHLAQMEGAHD